MYPPKDMRELFLNLQEVMEAKLLCARKSIAHPGAKGEAVEEEWRSWLREYLPKRYAVDKAQVIDCEGNLSDEIDIVIYDRQYSPFVFVDNGARYVPAESVYAVIEVKQELNREYLEYAGKKAESVRRLKRTSAPIYYMEGKTKQGKPLHRIPAGIVTTAAACKSGQTFRAFLEEQLRSHAADMERQIDFGCALQAGFFRADYKNGFMLELSPREETLISLFLWLFMELQRIATAPAIDIPAYAGVLEAFKDLPQAEPPKQAD